MIVKVEASPKKNKRFRAFLDDGRFFDFGLLGARTFIDDRTHNERMNYWKRHLGNKREEQLIQTLTISPSVLSAFLLWGETRDLDTNVKKLNDLILNL
jgi:hypothetical protein